MMTLGEGRSVCRTIQTRCISGHGVPHQMRKPAPLVTPWTKTGQNLAEGGPFGLQAELERRVKRKSRFNKAANHIVIASTEIARGISRV